MPLYSAHGDTSIREFCYVGKTIHCGAGTRNHRLHLGPFFLEKDGLLAATWNRPRATASGPPVAPAIYHRPWRAGRHAEPCLQRSDRNAVGGPVRSPGLEPISRSAEVTSDQMDEARVLFYRRARWAHRETSICRSGATTGSHHDPWKFHFSPPGGSGAETCCPGRACFVR